MLWEVNPDVGITKENGENEMGKKVVVKAGFHERKFCPVSYDLGKELEKVKVVDLEKGEEIPSQVEKGVLSWIVEDLREGESKEYLISDGGGSEFTGVELEEKEETVDVNIDGKLCTTYHFSKNVVRPFLNPVIGPDGKSLLRELFDKPEPPDHDHIHHRGILVAHGDVNGVDDWSEEEGHGFERHNCFRDMISGPVYGKIVAENSWVSKDEEKVITEIRTMKFYNVSEVRIIDFEIVFQATEGKVIFGDTKEGGILSVRIATPIRADRNGKIENAYGAIGESETWGKRASWCDYSGPLNGEIVGLAVLEHPGSFRYQTYWHVRNYGLMTANPFALSYYYQDKNRDGAHVLEANRELKFSYRVYIHRGDTTEGKVADAFHNYINPPEMEEVQ